MPYFHTRDAHYHRRSTVSRTCSGWEGVVPVRCRRQAKEVCRLRTCKDLEEGKGAIVVDGI